MIRRSVENWKTLKSSLPTPVSVLFHGKDTHNNFINGDEIIFLILAHTVYKMWIIQEPNKLALWNKLHFEEKKTESVEQV